RLSRPRGHLLVLRLAGVRRAILRQGSRGAWLDPRGPAGRVPPVSPVVVDWRGDASPPLHADPPPLPTPQPTMIGQTLGRYRIVESLGQGGMGIVYRAEDPRLEREVAIKVLNDDSLKDADASRRFRGEARALSRLLHPNVATLFDYDTDGGV